MTIDEKLDRIMQDLDYLSGMLCDARDKKERVAAAVAAIENDTCMECGAACGEESDGEVAPVSGTKPS